MYLKIFCGKQENGNEYKDWLLGQVKDGPVTICLHPSPGNIVGLDVILDDSLGSDEIIVKKYNNSIFAHGDMPSGVGISKDDNWWKKVGFPTKVIYTSSENENPSPSLLLGFIEDESKLESAEYRDEHGNETEAWKEDNVGKDDIYPL